MSKIKTLREKQGFTQEELAAKIGVGRTTVTMWEIGENLPPTRILPMLAATLHCTIDELLTTDDRPQEG